MTDIEFKRTEKGVKMPVTQAKAPEIKVEVQQSQVEKVSEVNLVGKEANIEAKVLARDGKVPKTEGNVVGRKHKVMEEVEESRQIEEAVPDIKVKVEGKEPEIEIQVLDKDVNVPRSEAKGPVMCYRKRKRVVVTVKEKLSALDRIDKGEGIIKIANELGVSENTIRDWKKNRQQLEEFCTNTDLSMSRRTLKKAKNSSVDEALWLWFVEEQKKGTVINGPILREKALIIEAMTTNKGDFVASSGWLSRWKKRHGVHFKDSSKEFPPLNKPENELICKGDYQEGLDLEESRLMPDCSLPNLDDSHSKRETLDSATYFDIASVINSYKEERSTRDILKTEDYITHTEGKEALNVALKYINQQPDASLIDVLLIKKWLDYASRKIPTFKMETETE